MTVKQMIRRLDKNAKNYISEGQMEKGCACAEVAAVLRRDFSDVRGHFYEQPIS